MPVFNQQLGGLQVNVWLIDAFGGVQIPGVGLGIRDLAPTAHLGQCPDGVGIEGVSGVFTEEDVEIGGGADVARLEFKMPGHGIGDDLGIGADIFGARQDFRRLGAVGTIIGIQPDGGADQRLGQRQHGLRVFIGKFGGQAEDLFGVLRENLIIGDDRHADAFDNGLLVPRLAHGIAVNGAQFHRGRHLRGRSHGNQHIRACLPGRIAGRVEAGMDAARRQPVPQFVIMGRDGKDHAQIKAAARRRLRLDRGFQGAGADRMGRFAIRAGGQARFHHGPDRIADGDRVAVQIHRQRRHDMGLRAIADGRGQGLARQHMRPVQLARDHPVQQHLPIRLRFQRDEQALVFKELLFIGDGQRGHIGQLDEAKRQVRLFDIQRLGPCRAGQGRAGQKDQGETGHDRSLRYEKAAETPAANWGEERGGGSAALP